MKIKEGDVVKLKSGGPNMTIKHTVVNNFSNTQHYRCTWFDNNIELQSAVFNENELKITDK